MHRSLLAISILLGPSVAPLKWPSGLKIDREAEVTSEDGLIQDPDLEAGGGGDASWVLGAGMNDEYIAGRALFDELFQKGGMAVTDGNMPRALGFFQQAQQVDPSNEQTNKSAPPQGHRGALAHRLGSITYSHQHALDSRNQRSDCEATQARL